MWLFSQTLIEKILGKMYFPLKSVALNLITYQLGAKLSWTTLYIVIFWYSHSSSVDSSLPFAHSSPLLALFIYIFSVPLFDLVVFVWRLGFFSLSLSLAFFRLFFSLRIFIEKIIKYKNIYVYSSEALTNWMEWVEKMKWMGKRDTTEEKSPPSRRKKVFSVLRT